MIRQLLVAISFVEPCAAYSYLRLLFFLKQFIYFLLSCTSRATTARDQCFLVFIPSGSQLKYIINYQVTTIEVSIDLVE